jgi:hypothetical protein
MRNGILAVVALTMGGVAIADPPPSQTEAQPVPQQVIEDLSELRQEFGQSTSTPAEFAQAVQNIAERGREFNNPFAESFNSTPQTAQAWAADGGPQPAQNPWNPGVSPQPALPPGYVVPASNDGWESPSQLQPGPPPGPPRGSQPPHHPFGPPPVPRHEKPGPRPPKVLLQDTAFDLERMAHELDKAELYGEADALRAAATRLRMAARQQRKPDGRPQPPQPPQPGIGPGPAPVEHPHAAERARRAIQEADERVRQMERQVREMEARIERQAEETRRQMQQMGERARRALESAERARQEAPEGPQRPRERRRERPDRPDRDRPDLPPPGVHGGPTDPPPPPAPPQLAPGQ